ncbi:MAG: AhpC/TSA family protein [Saprospiraceae bacterium]|nr:AhpC/TSA family protein [Saprospiraceae bacterium]
MKKILVIALVLSCLTAFGQGKKNVTIKGRLIHNIENKIYLSKLGQKELIILDSADVNKDGEFLIKTEVEKTDFYQLGFGKEDYMILILEPGEKIKLEVMSTNLNSPKLIEGSPASELVYSTNDSISFYKVKLDTLNKIYQKYYYTDKRDSISKILTEQYMGIEKLQKDYVRKTIKENYNSLACLIFIDNLEIKDDYEVFKNLANTLYEKYPENLFVVELNKSVKLEGKTAIGEIAPEIVQADTSGKMVSLSSLRGKVVLIDFWASWCGPCRRESPNMVRIYNQYKDKGFEIFGVSLDKSAEGWIGAIEKDKLSWTHVSDLKYWQSVPAKEYGVSSIPFTYLIDKNGRIIAKGLRGAELEQKLAEIFGE